MTALELLKSSDSMGALVLFVRSDEARRVIAAWPMIDVEFKDRPLKKGEDLKKVRNSIWSDSKFNLQALADQAEVPETRCTRMLARLMKANIVYPDGTISVAATKFIVSAAVAHTSIKPRRT